MIRGQELFFLGFVLGAGGIAMALFGLHKRRFQRLIQSHREQVDTHQYNYNVMISEVHDLYHHRLEEVRLQRDLRTAKEVQDTIMPQPSSVYSDWAVSGRSFTASECGGDWWYHGEVDGKILFWIGDVTGHSVASALVAAAARAAAASAQLAGISDPGEALAFANAVLTPLLKEKMFITCLVVAIDLKTGKGSYSMASHEPGVIFRADATKGEWAFFLNQGNNPPLGIPAQGGYGSSPLMMEPHDVLFLYTDGLHDVVGDFDRRRSQRAYFRLLNQWREECENGSEMVLKMTHRLARENLLNRLVDDVTFAVIQAPAEFASASQKRPA